MLLIARQHAATMADAIFMLMIIIDYAATCR